MTANQHTARVGFIGLGDQGAPMGQAIGDSGFGLHVWARRPQSLEVLARTRHTVHDSPASLAAATRPPMPSAPYHLSISAARAGALFASPLQRSDEHSARQVRQAIATAIAAYGVRGCAARVAQDYGEQPETALTRMRWALTAAASASGGSPAEPAHAPAPGHCTLCTSRAA